tara:strand:- start:1131 stop:1352 length:222 start_codon:yes stop_codon:yes gene_type:complete
MKHLKENKETYLSHLLFAGKVGFVLVFHGILFLLHALLPIGDIPKRWNLESLSAKLYRWSEYTIKRKQNETPT